MRPKLNSGNHRGHKGGIALCVSLLLAVAYPTASAQWNTGSRIILDGAAQEDRQVTGAWDPITEDAAIPVNALRSTATTITTISGWAPLTGMLTPGPSVLVPGMLITAVPSTSNPAAPMLDLNGSGALPIVDTDGLPLDSNTFLPGTPVRLMFEGTRYVVLNTLTLPCEPGYSAPNRAYCIADSSRAADTFFQAALDCASSGARLCTLSEWANACFHFPGFFATVPSGEWVDHAANHESTAKIAGAGDNGTVIGQGCDFGTLSVPTGLFRYRCCISR